MTPKPTGPADFAGYLFDLDGTLYLGDELIPGADEAVASLRARGARVVFLSNKPIETRQAYADKLTRLGIPADVDDVISSNFALAQYLKREMPDARVVVIGEEPVRAELRAAGLRFADTPGECDVLAVSWDREFTYEKLNWGFQALRLGARFVATNPDAACPLDGGRLVPDCAAMIGAFEGCSGRKVEVVAGKPSALIAEIALDRLGVPADRAAMVGDRLETDLRLARNAGLTAVTVLTGVTDRDRLAAWHEQPDFVLESVAELASL